MGNMRPVAQVVRMMVMVVGVMLVVQVADDDDSWNNSNDGGGGGGGRCCWRRRSVVGVGVAQAVQTLYFNESGSAEGWLDCDPSENTPGFMTTEFLSNDPFAFGCLSSQDAPSYYLSVVVSTRNFPNVPVWVANRDHPVKDNAKLWIDEHGDVILRDVDGSLIWRANISRAAGLTLTADGNLVVFDDQHVTLWQSFDEPLDLLVPNQTLRPGQTLTAGFSSPMPATGSFSAVMTSGGLILYEMSSSPPLPYLALRYPLEISTYKELMSSPCNHTLLQVTSTYLTQIQQPSVPEDPQCSIAPHNSTNLFPFDSSVAFIRLDADGNVRGYHIDYRPAFDMFKMISRGQCGIPNACGPYGICLPSSNTSSESQCTCPSSSSSSPQYVNSKSSWPSFTESNSVCVPQTPLACNQSQSNTFLDFTNLDYFANDFIPPTISSTSLSTCKSACASNCSCNAAFFRQKTGDCFLHSLVLSMMQVPHSDYRASIKVQQPLLSSNGRESSELKLIIGISVASALSVAFFTVWAYHKRKPRKSLHNRYLLKDDIELLSSLPGQPKRFSFRELQSATAEFSQKLGVGGFGSVYKGMFPDGSKVAVKQLENATKTMQGLKEFRAEVMVLSNINHQNLVHLRGFCADSNHRLLVYEFVPNGSLDTWLFSRPDSNSALDWETRLSIAIHTARGLFFLHEQCRHPIVHLDIKPQNILLDEKFVAKLSDFGLSRLVNEEASGAVSRMRGTPGYMAPECLILTDATEKSDVYSFGMVLLEIVSGRKNVDVSRLVVHGDGEGWYFPAMAAKKFKQGHLKDIVDNSLGKLSEDYMAEATRVIMIAFWCIQDDPSARPTMGNVLLMLQGYAPVESPPLSFNFGMRFHLSNTLTTSPREPTDTTIKPISEMEQQQEQHLKEEGQEQQQDEYDMPSFGTGQQEDKHDMPSSRIEEPLLSPASLKVGHIYSSNDPFPSPMSSRSSPSILHRHSAASASPTPSPREDSSSSDRRWPSSEQPSQSMSPTQPSQPISPAPSPTAISPHLSPSPTFSHMMSPKVHS